MALRAPWAVRINPASPGPVIRRVGIDEQACRALLFRFQALAAPVAVKVTHQYNTSMDGNTHPLQPVVITGVAVIGVNHRRGQISGWRIGIPWHLRGRIAGMGEIVARNQRLGMGQGHFIGRHNFNANAFWVGEKNLVFINAWVQTVALKFLKDEVRYPAVRRRAGDVRLSSKTLKIIAAMGGVGQLKKTLLPSLLRGIGGGAETHGRLTLFFLRRFRRSAKPASAWDNQSHGSGRKYPPKRPAQR